MRERARSKDTILRPPSLLNPLLQAIHCRRQGFLFLKCHGILLDPKRLLAINKPIHARLLSGHNLRKNWAFLDI